MKGWSVFSSEEETGNKNDEEAPNEPAAAVSAAAVVEEVNDDDDDEDDNDDAFQDTAAAGITANTPTSTVAPNSPPNKQRSITARGAPTTATTASTRRIIPACKPIVWCSLLVAILLIVIIVLACSLRRLGSTQFGIRYNVHNKELDDAARTGGLHIGPPGFKFIKFPSTQVTVDLPDDTCISFDGLRVKFSVTFQYQMKAEWLTPAIVKYRDYTRWTQVVEAAGNSAVHLSCALYTISNFQNKRGEIQKAMEDNLKRKLGGDPNGNGSDGVYANAISLQLRNIELPAEYQAAIAEKQAAAEDIILAQNQRTQETTKARTTLLSAQEQVKIVNNTAVNEADIILTEARIKGQEIAYAFETEALALVLAKSTLNLTSDGVLAYLSNRLYEKSATQLRVVTGEPARLSRKESL